jgi:hypothetical protein
MSRQFLTEPHRQKPAHVVRFGALLAAAVILYVVAIILFIVIY